MAFDEYDQSVEDSQPDEIYDFVYIGDNSHYRVTSSAYDVVFDANNYTAIPISRSEVRNTGEPAKNGLTVTVAKTNAYFVRFIAGTLTYDTTLTLYTLQPDGSYVVTWEGTVKSVSQMDRNIDVVLSPISTNANRPLMHRKFQVSCPHALYGYYCGVTKATYTHTGTIDSISGAVITSTTFGAQTDGYFAGGTIKVGSEIKTIIKHVGNDVTLLDPFYSNVIAGSSFTVVSGCDHSIATCRDKFSNEENFGGFPWIPSDDKITSGKPFVF